MLLAEWIDRGFRPHLAAACRRSHTAVSYVQTAQVAESKTTTATESSEQSQSALPQSPPEEVEVEVDKAKEEERPLPLTQVFLSALWAQKRQLAVVFTTLLIGM